jgi:amino acid transporter
LEKKKMIGVFTLAMINVAAVLSVRNFPQMSVYGWQSIGWYIIGLAFFLIPISLIGAELATGWPKGGGVYAWVKEAFGHKGGFVAIFCEWSNNLVWFPTVLSFVAGTFLFLVTNNNVATFVLMMAVLWGTTFVAFLGESVSTKFGNVGAILGSILPVILIVGMAIAFLGSGRTGQLPSFTVDQIVPTVNLDTLPFFSTVILMFAGMEMAGYHALETRNPKKDFPKAVFISAFIIFTLSTLGTIAIAMVVPQDQLQLNSGIMQALQYFLNDFGIGWALGIIGILVAIGGVALLTAWLIGPAKGLGVVAQSGDMPPFFNKTNKHGSPVGVLLVQGVIGTAISSIFLITANANNAFEALSELTSTVLCIAYILIFAAAIKLRYSQPDTPRPFKIPGGKLGMWIIAGMGIGGTAFAFFCALLPTGTSASAGGDIVFVFAMLIGTAILVVPPLIFMKLKKPSWDEAAKKTAEGPKQE